MVDCGEAYSMNRCRVGSDLAFDIDTAERLLSGHLEQMTSLASKEPRSVFAIFEKILTAIVAQELCTFLIVGKSKFFCQKLNLDIRLVSVM